MKTGDTEAQRAGSDDPATPAPTLLYLVKQVELSVRAGLDALVRPADITTLQYTALTVLERHPDLTAARLARHSFVTDQSMADMVTTLLNRGLIERHRDPADRRRLVIALTPAGQRLLDGLRCRTTCSRCFPTARPANCSARWNCAGAPCSNARSKVTHHRARRTENPGRSPPPGDSQETCTSGFRCGLLHNRE
jgi:DNA-binding MarR family transcriptional regulator